MSDLLEQLAETIQGCSRCGFCMVNCPAYGATKIEWDAARGRIKLAKDYVKGDAQLDKDLEDPVDTCLRCGSCYEVCDSNVNTPKAVQIMRTIRYKEGKLKLPYKILFGSIFPYPKRVTRLANLAGRAQRIVGEKRLREGFITRCYPASQMIPTLPKENARKRLPVINEAKGEKRGTVLYFLGCATDLVHPSVAQATLKLLQSQGLEVHVPNLSCCGLPAFTYGHIDGAVGLAKQNLEVLNLDKFDAVVSDCPTCLSFLKEYKDLPLEGEFLSKAQALADKVVNLPDFLIQIGFKPKKEIKKVVTYHQPCHSGRYPGAGKPIETLLAAIPGLEFRKAQNQDTCCGGAGSYCFTQFDRSKEILDQKIRGLIATGAETIITNCPACMMQLQAGLKSSEYDGKITVENLVSLLDTV